MWIDEFISCLDCANASEMEIEKGFLIKEQHIPTRLYKFRAVNQYALDNLQNDTVWLNSPDKYNDPYDSAATISLTESFNVTLKHHLEDIPGFDRLAQIIPADEIEKLRTAPNPMRQISRKVLESDPNISKDKIPEMLNDLEAAIHHIMAPTHSRLLEHVRSSIKICSFAATMAPITMWSHYADQHKGFCVEYNMAKMPAGDIRRRMLFPVIYKASLFDCTKYLAEALKEISRFNNVFAQLQALYKSAEWAYEQEWRLVFIGGVIREETNYPMAPVNRVYLGAKMPDGDRQRLIAICQSKDIECLQMHLKDDRFELEAEPIT